MRHLQREQSQTDSSIISRRSDPRVRPDLPQADMMSSVTPPRDGLTSASPSRNSAGHRRSPYVKACDRPSIIFGSSPMFEPGRTVKALKLLPASALRIRPPRAPCNAFIARSSVASARRSGKLMSPQIRVRRRGAARCGGLSHTIVAGQPHTPYGGHRILRSNMGSREWSPLRNP